VANLLSDDDKKLIRALRSTQLAEKLVAMLEHRRDSYNKALRASPLDKVQLFQGRAQELDELIDAVNYRE